MDAEADALLGVDDDEPPFEQGHMDYGGMSPVARAEPTGDTGSVSEDQGSVSSIPQGGSVSDQLPGDPFRGL